MHVVESRECVTLSVLLHPVMQHEQQLAGFTYL